MRIEKKTAARSIMIKYQCCTYLVHNHAILGIRQSLLGNVRLFISNADLNIAPDQKGSTILGPIHLVSNVETTGHVIDSNRHVLPIGDRVGVLFAQTVGVHVLTLGVGRFVNEPNSTEA
jgi:hypothetical protein